MKDSGTENEIVWSGVVWVAPLARVILEGLFEAVALEHECSRGEQPQGT